MAVAVIEQIVRSISRIGLALPIGSQEKGRADGRDDAFIGLLADQETFAMRGRAWIDDVVDMKRSFVGTDDCRCNVTASDVTPGAGVPIDTAMAPADHRMGAIKIAVRKMFWTDDIREIFASGGNWDDQTDMHAICLDKNRNALIRFAPVGICRNGTARQSRQKVKADREQRPAYQSANGRANAVDAKQFQV